jgi:carboxyl-terminal processing protease
MKKPTKKNLIIAAGYALVMVLGMIIGPKFLKENGNSANGSFLPFGMNSRSSNLDEILQIIGDNYVDSVRIDTVKGNVIQDVLSSLDPHSKYLPPVDAKLLYDDLEGNFDGIGVEYYVLNDTLLVTAVNEGGPAEKYGLLQGDRILKINGKTVTGIHLTGKQIVEKIRGRSGTAVNLTVKRHSNLIKQISVVRGKITISSIDIDYMIDKQTGYIKLSKFGAETTADFSKSLSKLQSAGMKNLILDLRDNGGGYLSAATELADQFLPDKKLIVYTQGVHEPRSDYFSTADGKFEQGKLVVLIDENSASASEILAGAIQDLDRGTIVGRRSFGKGLVQEQFDFSDGSALNLTIARYYTPSGRSIQRPYKNGAEAYYNEIADRYKNGELASDGKLNDTILSKQPKFTTKSGKVLYGGGGITPDIYIPLDTSGYTTFYRNLMAKGILNDYAFNYIPKSRAEGNLNMFINAFKLDETTFSKLISLADKRGIKASLNEIEISKQSISRTVKALLAKYYYGDLGYYKALNMDDKAIAKSLTVLESNNN